MKDLIKKILNEELTQRLSPEVILLFKLLQSKKTELKTKKNIIEFLEKRMNFFGFFISFSYIFFSFPIIKIN